MGSDPIFKWIGVLFRANQTFMARKLEPLGIGMGQYPLLLIICRSPGINQDALGEEHLLNKSTVTRAVAQLQENGFVRREVNPRDRRAYALYPTRKALDAVPEIRRLLDESVACIKKGLTEEEGALADALLENMAGAAMGLLDHTKKQPINHEEC